MKETADEIDQGEQDKENAAAVTLEQFMRGYLKERPEEQGVHFSDLIERVYYIPVKERPRRLFENWLGEIGGFSTFADYFFGLIAGWMVQSQVQNALDACDSVLSQVAEALSACQQRLGAVEQELEQVKTER